MKKYLLIIILLLTLSISGCQKKENYNTEFYKEYNIKTNLFTYKTVEEIFTDIDKNNTFLLFVGNPDTELSKDIINTLIDKSNYYGLNTIYYVNNKLDSIDEIINFLSETTNIFAVDIINGKIDDVIKENNSESIELIVRKTYETLETCNESC